MGVLRGMGLLAGGIVMFEGVYGREWTDNGLFVKESIHSFRCGLFLESLHEFASFSWPLGLVPLYN